MDINGVCEPAFSEVEAAFRDNFSRGGELGASVHVTVEGQTVVDLWAGDAAPGKPWEADTVSVVFSCTKAAVALAAHLLIDRGELELDAPMSRYWPEFAQNGKAGATVRMALDHAVGVPALRDPVAPGGFFDWDQMVDDLARTKPFWEPGTRNGYHMITFGWVIGELIRRVSGKGLGEFFAQEIANPLNLDFWIGLPDSVETRVAPVQFPSRRDAPTTEFTQAIVDDRGSIQALAWLNSGGYLEDVDAPAAHRAQIGGAGGIANARALARMFAPLANDGRHGQTQFIGERAITRMSTTSVATHQDATLLLPTKFALGFMKSMDNRARPNGAIESVILGQNAFGHVGAGGSLGFADPDARLSFGYTMNQMGHGILLNQRGQTLVDATYRAMGYTDNSAGCWVK